MKIYKKLKMALLFMIFSAYCCSAVGCDEIASYFKDSEQASSSESVEEVERYTIMYNDGKNHSITVEHGGLWQMDKPLPTKDGYVFDGLYTATEGGVKYASKYGMCVTPFYDEQNMVLYPQFLPEEYKLLLTYGEATQSGEPFVTVESGQDIPTLPYALSIPNKEYMNFTGWYTKENGQGVQVTDSEGKPLKNIESLFKGIDGNEISLYAGFSVQTYSLTFMTTDGNVLNKIEVEHGTDFASVVPEIIVGGKNVATWTRSVHSNQPFEGTIYSDETLYPHSYNLRIEIDADGGSGSKIWEIDEGEVITLPSTSRSGYTFLGWYNGNTKIDETVISPIVNMVITAKWEANKYLISLDANDGTVSAPTQTLTYGKTYTLPVPTREGYRFNGWYYENAVTNENGSSLSSWKMAQTVTLTAKWSKDWSIALTKQSCADKNGYNPANEGSGDDKKTQRDYHMIGLTILDGIEGVNGGLTAKGKTNLSLQFTMLENPDNLPRCSNNGFWNWYVNGLTSDTNTGTNNVYGTNITGKEIGKGAYYFKLTYSDNTTEEINATNFMADMKQGDTKTVDISINQYKTLSKIDVVIVFEIYYEHYTNLAWYSGYANWRHTATIAFE